MKTYLIDIAQDYVITAVWNPQQPNEITLDHGLDPIPYYDHTLSIEELLRYEYHNALAIIER